MRDRVNIVGRKRDVDLVAPHLDYTKECDSARESLDIIDGRQHEDQRVASSFPRETGRAGHERTQTLANSFGDIASGNSPRPVRVGWDPPDCDINRPSGDLPRELLRANVQIIRRRDHGIAERWTAMPSLLPESWRRAGRLSSARLPTALLGSAPGPALPRVAPFRPRKCPAS
jgi:hypothetical protein